METGFLDKNMLDFIKNILDIDLSKDLIFIKNNNFEYSYVNSVFCDMFNLKIEDVIGKKDNAI
ncbi:PAS domain-containing protein [Fusobacterium necrogenes]|uniref:PAS domain-containing protein n=1 Tax=Fusobacterium necrogenes TaxID=858 RepID=UPI00255CC7B3|nr:PAS domain-containing protein [Fusobacterium necrogenes]